MVWMVLALMLSAVLFIVNILIARVVTEAGFSPTNVAWVTSPAAAFALFLAGAPTGLFVTVGIIVGIIPYFLGQLPVVKGWIDATTTLLKSRRPQRG
jgi:hypothetical protein